VSPGAVGAAVLGETVGETVVGEDVKLLVTVIATMVP
jgi:hypothetical protein